MQSRIDRTGSQATRRRTRATSLSLKTTTVSSRAGVGMIRTARVVAASSHKPPGLQFEASEKRATVGERCGRGRSRCVWSAPWHRRARAAESGPPRSSDARGARTRTPVPRHLAGESGGLDDLKKVDDPWSTSATWVPGPKRSSITASICRRRPDVRGSGFRAQRRKVGAAREMPVAEAERGFLAGSGAPGRTDYRRSRIERVTSVGPPLCAWSDRD